MNSNTTATGQKDDTAETAKGVKGKEEDKMQKMKIKRKKSKKICRHKRSGCCTSS